MSALRCVVCHPDHTFWVRLIPDATRPGKLVAKDWDGKICFFRAVDTMPKAWVAERYVLVTQFKLSDKFRIVTPAEVMCENKELDERARALFAGRLDASFDLPDDNLILDWLDAKTQEVLCGDALTAAIDKTAAELELKLNQLHNEELVLSGCTWLEGH